MCWRVTPLSTFYPKQSYPTIHLTPPLFPTKKVFWAHLKTSSVIHSKFCAPKRPHPKQIFSTPGRKEDSGVTRPSFRKFFANQKKSKNKNKDETKTTNTKPTQKRKQLEKNTHTHQTSASLGEVGPKEKTKITKGDLKDKQKQETKKTKQMLMRTTFKMYHFDVLLCMKQK